VPSRRHSHSGHEQIETCGGFDSEYTVILDGPVKVSEQVATEKRGLSYLFIDVLQRSIGVLTVANTMAPHTCLAGILFALDQHLDLT
jgi:hypothetical protein